ncbi:MAG: PAS domain S-box protein [Desulfobacterales bacterium]|nr:PAS domain S-box protein [Desulfobacterales bacterium]
MKDIIGRTKIFHKFILLSATLIASLLLVGIISYRNLAQQENVINDIANNKFKNLINISSSSQKILSIHNELGKIVRWTAFGYITAEESKNSISDLVKHLDTIKKNQLNSLLKLRSKEDKAILRAVEEYQEWIASISEILLLDEDLANIYLGSADETINFLGKYLNESEMQYEKLISRFFITSQERFADTIFVFFLIFSFSVLISILVLSFTGKYILSNVNNFTKTLKYITKTKDLTKKVEVKSKDELGILAEYFNHFISELNRYSHHLESMVSERTIKLANINKQLQLEITERKEAERALREAEEFRSGLLNNSPNPIIVIGSDKKIKYVNPALENLTGFSAAELIGNKSPHPWWTKETLPKILKDFDQALNHGIDKTEEYFQKKNGERFWIEITGVSVKKNGVFNYYLANWVNITDYKQAQSALQESEKKYSTLVENSLTGIYINQNGKIIFANKRFAEIYGYSQEELAGIESWRLVHPEDRAFVAELREKRLIGGKVPSEYRARGLKKDGSIIWIERINSLIDYKGEPAILGNIMDITLRKQMEEKLEKSKHELQFLSSQLLKAQEDERKKISLELHDTIAQNLVAIKIFLNNKLKTSDANSAHSEISLETIVSMVQKSIEELRRIMSDLRPPILDALGIVAAIKSFCRDFQEMYNTIRIIKKIEIQENQVPSHLKIVIYRILQEAMSNIAKHSKADLIHIELRKENNHIEMSIKDNGQGFDLNERYSSGSPEKGLGLISMKERTELSNGYFSIDSDKGTGTRVKVYWGNISDIGKKSPKTCY